MHVSSAASVLMNEQTREKEGGCLKALIRKLGEKQALETILIEADHLP